MLKQNPFKKYRPEVTLTISFAAVILVGACLLTLDISNAKTGISFIDALFTATTATCVTGLVTVVPAEQFTIFGQVVVLLLIQIGGLGLMTFVSVILLFMRAKLEFKEKLLLKDALNKDDFQGVGGYIKAIIRYTFIIEFIGFLFLFSQMYKGENLPMELFQALFTAISAFCNAGIDNLGPNSLMMYQSNVVVNLTVSFLIILGGIGFAVWFDIAHNLKLASRSLHKIKDFSRRLRINTRIAVMVTLFLIFGGMALIFIIEYDNALAGLTLPDKLMASFFNSVTLRTAGFFTIDYTILHDATKLIMIILMFIGGSPGGTAGGIKTTTFFLLLYTITSLIREQSNVHFFKRQVQPGNIIRAFVILLVYLMIVLTATFFLTILENQSFVDIVFEVVSALGTVGLTCGITTSLCSLSKIIIIACMFLGRVGPITIASSLRRKAKNDKDVRYPSVDIVVG